MKKQSLKFLLITLIIIIYGIQIAIAVNPQPFAADATSITGAPETIFEHLTAQEEAPLTIITDLSGLKKNRKLDEYQSATLVDNNGQKWNVEVKPRGRYRRKNAVVPPLKLRFDARELTKAGMSPNNELKIATAMYDTEAGNAYIIKEYLTYKMYEAITPLSMRVRLAKIRFEDHKQKSLQVNMYCLVLENDDDLNERLHLKEINAYGLSPADLHTEQVALAAAFNYMIGNRDFDIEGRRNVKLVTSTLEKTKTLVIPYDFDFSGLVAAEYAKVTDLDGRKVTSKRQLMADGIDKNALKNAFQILHNHRSKLESICNSPLLDRSTRLEMLEYLHSFFSIDNFQWTIDN